MTAVGLNVYMAKDGSMQEMVIKVRHKGSYRLPIREMMAEDLGFYGRVVRRGGA